MSQNDTPQVGARCTVCRKHKFSLRARKSQLNTGMPLYLCDDCFTKRYEPRWLVILVGQEEGGLEKIQDYLVNHKYVGKDISASELIK